MRRTGRFPIAILVVAFSVVPFPSQVSADDSPAKPIRFATFNVFELSAKKLAEVDSEGKGVNVQLRNAAEVIQRIRPDVLLLNEIDFDIATRANGQLFQDRYLRHSQSGQQPISFEHLYFDEVNTGVPSGRDFDHNGKLGDPEDGFGFGRYPGQYGMALYSKHEIVRDKIRTFRKLLWKEMPSHLMPDGANGSPAWYSADDAKVFRLSSKSHWDVPIKIGDKVVHALCSHPTPPVFDGPEDRNGRRNFDEIRLWSDYLSGGSAASYIRDDQGQGGGLAESEHFVILGDLNADPTKDKDVPYKVRAIDQLLLHPRVQRTDPTSKGALEKKTAGAPIFPERWTAHFGRADYVLPSKSLEVVSCGVFWPDSADPLHRLFERKTQASDHRPVWVDLKVK